MNLCIQFMVTGHYPSRVSPFGDLWIIAYLQLTTAFRSLSRPSSAISAMASTLRSYSLDLLPNLHPTLLRLLRGQTEALVLSIVCCCFLYSCAVFKVRLKFCSKLQNDTETIFDFKKTFRFSPTFAGFLPVFLRLCFLLKPFIFRLASGISSFNDRTDLGSRASYSDAHFSLERR